MKRISVSLHSGRTFDRVVGTLLALGILACLLLVMLGLWLVFAVAIALVALLAIVRAFMPRRRRRGQPIAVEYSRDDELPDRNGAPRP